MKQNLAQWQEFYDNYIKTKPGQNPDI
jgi:hypothetical protein